MEARFISPVLIFFICQRVNKVLSYETTPGESELEPEGPRDPYVVQEEAKVLLERDRYLRPQFVAIIHNRFPHPTFPGERSPWFQVYVYSDFFQGMPMEEVSESCHYKVFNFYLCNNVSKTVLVTGENCP